MSREDILATVTDILRDAFDREDLEITDETTASDVEGWDSLMQINIIEMVEDEFEITFDMDEATGMKNVGAMVDIVAGKLGA